MAGKNTNNVILYIAFWALYGPITLVLWHKEGSSLLKLGILLLIGLGTVLAALFANEYVAQRKRTAVNVPVEEPAEATAEPVAYFDNVFKPDFGKVEIDLD